MENLEKEEPVLSIQKAKIKDHFLTAEYTVVENEVMTKYTAEFMRFVHEDLLQRFQYLVVHLCLITEQVRISTVCQMMDLMLAEVEISVNKQGNLEEELLAPSTYEVARVRQALFDEKLYDLVCFTNFRCTGFVNSNSGVMLIGQKVLKSGKVLNLLTPLTSLEESDYEFANILAMDLKMAYNEVIAHINGKGTGGQLLDLFNQEEAA